jgi:hypothetical protein
MVVRVVRSVVLTVLTGLILTGCGRQVARDSSRDPDLPATGPAFASAPRSFLLPSVEAVGGLTAWKQVKRIEFGAIVTAQYPEGGAYLTEHRFLLYPWSDGIEVTADEPRVRMIWRVHCGVCSIEGDPALDNSPLNGVYHEYADAVLQIVTTPARLMEGNVALTRKPIPVQIAGQWYQAVEAKFGSQEIVSSRKDHKRVTVFAPYWTQGTYFQSYASAIVDMIWLANPGEQRYVLVRGYDYAPVADEGILIPTKIEVFRSDAQARFGPRLAQIDLKR